MIPRQDLTSRVQRATLTRPVELTAAERRRVERSNPDHDHVNDAYTFMVSGPDKVVVALGLEMKTFLRARVLDGKYVASGGRFAFDPRALTGSVVHGDGGSLESTEMRHENALATVLDPHPAGGPLPAHTQSRLVTFKPVDRNCGTKARCVCGAATACIILIIARLRR